MTGRHPRLDRGSLSTLIHFFVILLIIPGSHIVQPGLVVQVPADGFLDALLELEGRLPAQLPLQLGGVDGIAKVMPGTVRHIGDEVHVFAGGAVQQPVHGIDEHLHDVDVLPLVEPADVVGLGDLPLVEDQVDGAGVVLHVQPVADVLAPAVHGQGFPVPDVIDKQRDKLFRELVRPVVVGTVRDDGGHPVGVVESPHEMVAGRLRRAVGAVRLVLEVLREELLAVGQVMLAAGRLRREGRLDALGMRHLQRAVHLVGGDVVEAARDNHPFGAVHLIAEGLPERLRGLQHRQGADDIGPGEGEGILDGTVHVGFGRQVDDAVHPVVGDDPQHRLEIADIGLDEEVVGPVLDVPEVREIARVGELVQVDDPVLRVFVHEQPHDVAADETGSAGDEDGSTHFHIRGKKDDACLFRKG